MAPVVSVCLPVYNGEQFVSSAVETILGQTFTDLELIICDDASTDGSAEIIRKIARQDKRVLAFYNDERHGLFANYNLCIQRASGRFIKPFAQDDLLELSCLKEMTAILEKHQQLSLLSSARLWINENGQVHPDNDDILSFDDLFPAAKVVDGHAVVRESLLPLVNFIGEPSTVMFRGNSAARFFNAELYHLGDLEFWLRLLLEGDFYFIPQQLCKFRSHENSSSSFNTRTLFNWLDYVKIQRVIEPHLAALGLNESEFLRKNLAVLAEQAELVDLRYEELRDQKKAIQDLYHPPGTEMTELRLERVLEDLLAFRDLSFLALAGAEKVELLKKRVVSAKKSSQDYVQVRRNAIEISRLETRISRMLSSYSWRLTRVFREFNKQCGLSMPANYKQVLEKKKLELYESGDALEYQRTYIGYLRRQIAYLKKSRSWRYTGIFRSLGKTLKSEENHSRTTNGARKDSSRHQPEILILTPVKNAAEFADGYFERLRGLSYPSEKLSIGILESDSNDGTYKIFAEACRSKLFDFRKTTVLQRNFGYKIPENLERWDASIQFQRRAVLARSRNHLLFHALDDEDWVLWLDVDVIDYPADIIEKLLSYKKDIIMPHCVHEHSRETFDQNVWRDKGRLSIMDMRGDGEILPVDTAGGTMLMVRADCHRDGLVFPPFLYGKRSDKIRPLGKGIVADSEGEIETEGFGIMAADMNLQCWVLPGLEVSHAGK